LSQFETNKVINQETYTRDVERNQERKKEEKINSKKKQKILEVSVKNVRTMEHPRT